MGESSLAVVTGGAGFIGSHLAEALRAEGLRVRVVDNLSTGRPENLAHLGDAVELVRADLADFDAACRAVEGATFVFHQAAIPSVPRSVREPLRSHASGPTATLNVLEAARQAGVRRVTPRPVAAGPAASRAPSGPRAPGSPSPCPPTGPPTPTPCSPSRPPPESSAIGSPRPARPTRSSRAGVSRRVPPPSTIPDRARIGCLHR